MFVVNNSKNAIDVRLTVFKDSGEYTTRLEPDDAAEFGAVVLPSGDQGNLQASVVDSGTYDAGYVVSSDSQVAYDGEKFGPASSSIPDRKNFCVFRYIMGKWEPTGESNCDDGHTCPKASVVNAEHVAGYDGQLLYVECVEDK